MNKFEERINEIRYNKKGYPMKIVSYTNTNKIIVEFQDEFKYRTQTTYDNFKKGSVENKLATSEKVGEIKKNRYGTYMKIIEYKSYDNVTVQFQDEHKAIVKGIKYNHFKTGVVKNPYDKSIYGIAYIGEGEYSYSTHTHIHRTWVGMLRRCYDPYFINTRAITYKDVIVCKEWLNFQNFAKWYEDNYYEVPNERMQIDKDILYKDNKIYSPDTCLIVPGCINVIFNKTENNKTNNLPLGCSYHHGHIYVRCITLEGTSSLGVFDKNDIENAFKLYKTYKEQYIKQIADKYSRYIPKVVYDAMYAYKIDIND